MTTFDLHPWNFMPMEILAHIFSFLPVRDRHNVSRTCQLWASTVSTALVWRFTEVHCDSEETEEEEEEENGDTASTLLQKIQPYMGHIRYLKLVFSISQELNRMLACTILDVMAQKSRRLQGLQIVCHGRTPDFYSGQDILQSLGGLFQGMDEATMQHIDLRRMPFILDNRLILQVGSCSPNLRFFHFNSHVPAVTLLRAETIVELLRSCPKLFSLGVSYVALSQKMFQELLKPNREPLKYLELFYGGLDNDIPEECWTSVKEKHPDFRLGLEFATSITTQKMTEVLKPYLPISHLRITSLTHMTSQVALVTNLYAGTLERLVLYSSPSLELNVALIRLAKTCSHLKEMHCLFVVAKGVEMAFRNNCPHLKKYTLSHTLFFPDNPPTITL